MKPTEKYLNKIAQCGLNRYRHNNNQPIIDPKTGKYYQAKNKAIIVWTEVKG